MPENDWWHLKITENNLKNHTWLILLPTHCQALMACAKKKEKRKKKKEKKKKEKEKERQQKAKTNNATKQNEMTWENHTTNQNKTNTCNMQTTWIPLVTLHECLGGGKPQMVVSPFFGRCSQSFAPSANVCNAVQNAHKTCAKCVQKCPKYTKKCPKCTKNHFLT